MNLTSLKAQPRVVGLKSTVNDLRKNGSAPAVLYGKNTKPVSLSIDLSEFRHIDVPGNRQGLVSLEIEGGKPVSAMVQSVQRDIITGVVQHIDFIEISEDKPVKVTVPVHLSGVAVGVKTEGGQLFQDRKSVDVSCLPADIPKSIEIDVTPFHSSQTFYVRDIELADSIQMKTTSRAVIFSISKGRSADVEAEAVAAEA